MRFLISILAATFVSTAAFAAHHEEAGQQAGPLTIVIHGGAGALEPGRYTAEEEAAYKAKLTEALNAGYSVMEQGGTAMDAIVAAIVLMEDSPLFNAGKGAVFTSEGKNELDSSIMDGETMNAGAVAGVTRVKNPIKLARAVMENSEHVMFAREGAEEFAEEQGLEFVNPKYFRTERRWQSYKNALERQKQQKDSALPKSFKYGTVGAVALDAHGNLAAGTSTGGMNMKKYGRVGDSPIIGAGTFADNKSCAVSSTGWGEYFIRLTIARDICAQVEYGGASVEDAADDMINNKLQSMGADGGVIVLGPDGSYAMTFNSAGMFRGVKNAEMEEVAIYGE
ncbi:isoaspartyl peptidase/L-asparaginase [Hyphococcus flavus]|uniref:Isoaspartyl peptidase n=1 Tax=Hyphococcus flavus TaxID=1866326 RepID=A0AAE9ZAQ2_9PROT|nr:isoaspartyl peptidase/L-asparaginase [Hyphococcus flavus]WDI30818.1 isoaspartyl peptidase/L-asparaginase [Hyphococcus flavus]